MAAEKLFIAQPSLTSAIHNIEEEMGITAFIRSNKGVELTRDGETLLSYARQILEQTDVMTEHFKGERNQKPRFSVSCQQNSFPSKLDRKFCRMMENGWLNLSIPVQIIFVNG